MSKTVPERSPHARAPDPMCGEMRKSGSYEQKTGGYEQCCSERTEQIRSRATDKIKKKELNDNPYYNPLRSSILVRSNDLLSYTLFEEENRRYAASNYSWEENKNGNLIGIDIDTGEIRFTWQPHGSQFTIHTKVPSNAVKFKIKQPPMLDVEKTLKQINYDDDWVEIL